MDSLLSMFIRTVSSLHLLHNGLNYGPVLGPDPALPNRTFSGEDFSDGVKMRDDLDEHQR